MMADAPQNQDISGYLSQMMMAAPMMGGQRSVDEASMPWNQPQNLRTSRVNSSEPGVYDATDSTGGQALTQAQLDQMFPGLPANQQAWIARTQGYAVDQNAGVSPMTWGRALGLQNMGIQLPSAPWSGPNWQNDLATAWQQKGGLQGFLSGAF